MMYGIVNGNGDDHKKVQQQEQWKQKHVDEEVAEATAPPLPRQPMLISN